MLTVNEIFLLDPGRIDARRAPVRLRAPDRLRSALLVVRYAVCVQRSKKMTTDEVVAWWTRHRRPLVEITGGEPLLQDDVNELMDEAA